MANERLAKRIVHWQRTHGRHHLPWQDTRDPYRVWLSEIMLQQTQVATVIEYYHRFLKRFPTVQDLAKAELDEVLALWAGLGYYARARNLHACAQAVLQNWQGAFPDSATDLQTLPGIGASTAAAIAAFCSGERVAILDGNVKRVLTRYLAIDQDVTNSSTTKYLWEIAQREVPSVAHTKAEPDAMARYTQGMMDLGATICTRTKPKCELCPLKTSCMARKLGTAEQFPVKPVKKKGKPSRDMDLLWLSCGDHVLLEQRPAKGVWGGLWCMPTDVGMTDRLGLIKPLRMASFAHELTHFRMVITPWRLAITGDLHPMPVVAEHQRWVPLTKLKDYGLPKPVRGLLTESDER